MSDNVELMVPIEVTPASARLTSSNIPDPAVGDSPDPAVWSGATTYALADRVRDNTAKKIYESLQASNTNHAVTDAAWWIEVGYINRYRMFDGRNTTQSTMVGLIDVEATPTALPFSTLTVLNITGADVAQVTQIDPSAGTVFDSGSVTLRAPPTRADYYEYFFDPIVRKNFLYINELRAYPNSKVKLVLTANNGTDVVGVGTFAVGKSFVLGGAANFGMRFGIQDFSRKERNAFGDFEIVPRGFSKRMSLNFWVENNDVDASADMLNLARSTACIWRGSPNFRSALIYGFYKDYEIVVQHYDQSLLSAEIEGITE